jgi:hypothetical protein
MEQLSQWALILIIVAVSLLFIITCLCMCRRSCINPKTGRYSCHYCSVAICYFMKCQCCRRCKKDKHKKNHRNDSDIDLDLDKTIPTPTTTKTNDSQRCGCCRRSRTTSGTTTTAPTGGGRGEGAIGNIDAAIHSGVGSRCMIGTRVNNVPPARTDAEAAAILEAEFAGVFGSPVTGGEQNATPASSQLASPINSDVRRDNSTFTFSNPRVPHPYTPSMSQRRPLDAVGIASNGPPFRSLLS